MTNKRILCCVALCIALIVFAFCGCQNDSEQDIDILTSEAENANIVDEDFSNEIQEEWNLSIPKNQPEFLNLLDEKSSFECLTTESLGDGYYVVNVSVSSPNIGESLKAYQENVSSEKISTDEMNKKLCELINSAEIKTSNQSVDVIVDEDNNVRVQFNDDFINAMFGYVYIESMQSLMNEQVGEN